MKAKISIALLALVAVAFLAVAPASADLTVVPLGGVVFVGEEGLTFTSVAPTLEWFAAGDDPTTASPSATYTTQGAGNEVIDPATFQTRTGNWYEAGGLGVVAINVQMPSIDVKVYNTVTGEDMTNERVVKTGTTMAFRLDSNLYQVVNQRPALAGQSTAIKVVVVDSEGTTYTGLVEDAATGFVSSLTGLAPTNSQYYLPDSLGASGIGVPNWDLESSQYKAGVYTFYAEVNLNNAKDNVGTVTGVTKSAVKTLEVGKDDVKIEANKDTVVRNNDFAVTITGRPNEQYVLWVKGTSSISAPDTVPYIKDNQNSVSVNNALAGAYVFSGVAGGTNVLTDVSGSAPASGGYYAMVTLSSSGTRTVGFGTDDTTKDQTYTLRTDYYQAVFPFSPTYDTVKVKVEKGAVTVTASGDSSYYIGEEIVISGTNTDSDDTWLFITGPNLKTKGAPITDPKDGVVTGGTTDNNPIAGSWAPVTVETDDTWEYKWSTAGVNLDAGTYTIYSVTTPTNKDDLGANNAIYATASIVIKKPFVTATTSSATVARGDDLYITGNAEGDPTPGVAIWILGKNFNDIQTETVEDNGAFSYKFTGTDTLAAGQYFVVVQHPMYNDQFDLATRANCPAAGQTCVDRPILNPFVPVFIIEGPGSLQGSDAATALVNAMDSPDIDDTYYKLTFMIEEPWIMIDAIGDKYVGETFTITGTTNLAVGDSLIVEATSASFKPTEKTQSGSFSGASGTVLVTAGDKDGVNVWEFAVDASSFTPDEYIVTVEGIEAQQTATQTFNVLKAEATAQPTATAVPTAQPTATAVPTTAATPEPTATPGFGVLVALIGLGAVAALIVRKD
ncbi:DUF3821 domain-containing protein [Methanogenium sp. S4BF]|uniref:MEMAR_RS02690 family S-layer glycoprotein n=1 Tax=Methanogenium sp. S4BF TaxID=1789226 RepID=UPI0024180464|nr:MEMAR_RS02690 family S-layer glycoprotein [Methanogenium sp. S4BF]WFN33576.1 DUF3821 domain-containing protein [Methanogenium sp. S4BF]